MTKFQSKLLHAAFLILALRNVEINRWTIQVDVILKHVFLDVSGHPRVY